MSKIWRYYDLHSGICTPHTQKSTMKHKPPKQKNQLYWSCSNEPDKLVELLPKILFSDDHIRESVGTCVESVSQSLQPIHMLGIVWFMTRTTFACGIFFYLFIFRDSQMFGACHRRVEDVSLMDLGLTFKKLSTHTRQTSNDTHFARISHCIFN